MGRFGGKDTFAFPSQEEADAQGARDRKALYEAQNYTPLDIARSNFAHARIVNTNQVQQLEDFIRAVVRDELAAAEATALRAR